MKRINVCLRYRYSIIIFSLSLKRFDILIQLHLVYFNMTSCFYFLVYKWKENNFEHNRIVSRHKAFVSSINENCLIFEKVQHEGLTCISIYLKWALLRGALNCGFPWIYYVTEHLKKYLSISPRPSPWPRKVPTIAHSFQSFNFCCWKEGLVTKPKIFRFLIPLLSWSQVQIHKQTALKYGKPGLIPSQQNLFLFYPQETHLCNLRSQILSPWALIKSHFHFFPIFFLQPNNNFSFSSTGPGRRITRVLLLEILHNHSHPQTQEINRFPA